jgi:hypothetical protein
MLRLWGVAAMAFVCAVSVAQASPRHKHHRHDSESARACVFTNGGRVICQGGTNRTHDRARVTARHVDNLAVIGGRPAGCPHAFCGCEASLYVFGRIIPKLNLASNWIRAFPRSSPAPGMAAARNHHVMVLISHVSGRDWLVHDGNSGGHKTREHVRSIAGYVIVDPRASTAYND